MHGGCDVARQAILLRPGLRVLYTTASRDPEKMHARFAAGTHFLPKPYTEHQLGLSIQSLLAAHSKSRFVREIDIATSASAETAPY
jgi:CheY-like chemotaxis protein